MQGDQPRGGTLKVIWRLDVLLWDRSPEFQGSFYNIVCQHFLIEVHWPDVACFKAGNMQLWSTATQQLLPPQIDLTLDWGLGWESKNPHRGTRDRQDRFLYKPDKFSGLEKNLKYQNKNHWENSINDRCEVIGHCDLMRSYSWPFGDTYANTRRGFSGFSGLVV